MKSTKGYWIGGGLIVLGAVLAVLWFAIADAESGDDLVIDSYDGSLEYSFGERDGSAQGTVTPPRAGDYVVTTGSDDAGSDAVVALGDSIAAPLLRTIVGALAIGALLVFAGVILLVVTAIRLNRERSIRPVSRGL